MIKVPVFYYHSIGNRGPETLAVDRFRGHLELIKELGFHTITFSELRQTHCSDQKRHVVLTFDDGLLDNYDNALPLLQEYGAKATFFVIPGFDDIIRWVNPKTRQWSDERRAGFSIPFPGMQPHHRRELIRIGMEIGCHSMTHPNLNKIPRSALHYEIVDSKKQLEDELDVEISSFCYPKGRCNLHVKECVKQAGYTGACTTMPGFYRPDGKPLECGRFLIESCALFNKVLRWSSLAHHPSELAFDAIRPFLRIKNHCL